ncbi:MAG: outer membrane lipoprotein SlyB [Gammaproteobacteria bacterium]|jgi:outer membrane lipoprotein SlyB
MKLNQYINIIICTSIVLLSGCAASRPVLYPNSHLNTVGMEVADSDINSCISMAKASGADNDKLTETTTETLEGGVIGGATGAVVGAVFGRPGQGAASGAAGGATGRLTSSLFDLDKPDHVYQKFVDRCLYDKGYEMVGWK